ncbi:MAG: hypothetical protein GXY33_19170 [Phycisphaerae bacterium]|nr:hypothetical protein [Phycisphaerae bacterium]
MWMGWSKTFGEPLAAPLTLNFLPSWWYRQYGISHGERVFRDPEFRAATQREMHRLVYDRFKDLGFGQEDPPLVYCADHLGNATMPAMLGCEVRFADDQYPVNNPLPMDVLRRLAVPKDITQSFPLNDILGQERQIAQKTGSRVDLIWPTQGVQNIALLTQGSDFYTEYYENPEWAGRLLDVSCDLIIAILEYQKSRGQELMLFSHQNCTVELCGPKVYREFLLAYDLRLYRTAARLGWKYNIHHCGVFDAFAELYRQIGPLDSIQVGWGSDLRLALDTFPEAKVDYIISPTFLHDADPRAIADRVRGLVDAAGGDLARTSFTVCDVEDGTPDSSIFAVAEALAGRG